MELIWISKKGFNFSTFLMFFVVLCGGGFEIYLAIVGCESWTIVYIKMKTHNFYPGSGENVYEKLDEKEVEIGDELRELHNNQLGTKLYKVIKGKNGKKMLRLLEEDGYKFTSYTSDSSPSRSPSRSHSRSHSPSSPSRKRRKTGGKRKTYKKGDRK